MPRALFALPITNNLRRIDPASVVQALGLFVLVGVQPWLLWPSLSPDVSHRMTLVCCCALLGLSQMAQVGVRTPIPLHAILVAGLALVSMVVHQSAIIHNADYFRFFQETAVFSDGIILVLSICWGLWALQQIPLRYFRWLRWAGLGMVGLNVAISIIQICGHRWSWGAFMPSATSTATPWLGGALGRATGLMGYDRLLGAYAVAWLPILLSWQPWMAILPMFLVLVSGKVTAWIGASVVLWKMRPTVRWWMVALVSVCVLHFTDGALFEKFTERLVTWRHLFQMTLVHPWVGWGFAPMTFERAIQGVGYVLPGGHSDWMMLAFHAGWAVTLVGVWWWWTMASHHDPVSVSLLAIGVMSMMQSVARHPRMDGVLMLLVVWWMKEHERESHA